MGRTLIITEALQDVPKDCSGKGEGIGFTAQYWLLFCFICINIITNVHLLYSYYQCAKLIINNKSDGGVCENKATSERVQGATPKIT